MEDLEEVSIVENELTRVVKVGKNLKMEVRAQLVEYLRRNQDVFAWSHKDMVGISQTMIIHVLNMDENYPAVQQKRRLLDKE